MPIKIPRLSFAQIATMLSGAVFAVSVLWMASTISGDATLASSMMLFTMVVFGGLGANSAQRIQRTFLHFGYTKGLAKALSIVMYLLWVLVGFLAIRFSPFI
ncbi:hypothetical protein [Bowmanella sp. JS7-9]|uniref:Uncharacterized protein n=1 Tax=Pseudobowmanella zhangzhouensis TaxID=1537679 RepID=A0ABW1XEW5_9ALTE|nr:hypothetical protein [Bowmanella sp. JS7-9]